MSTISCNCHIPCGGVGNLLCLRHSSRTIMSWHDPTISAPTYVNNPMHVHNGTHIYRCIMFPIYVVKFPVTLDDEDITMLNTHTPRPFPCWSSSPTQLPRPSRIQPTLTHGFGDNSIIRHRNEAYKYSLERGR
jgi:hypothetical protein